MCQEKPHLKTGPTSITISTTTTTTSTRCTTPQQMDIPSPQQKSEPPKQIVTHELLSEKHRPYQIPRPRTQSAERTKTEGLARTSSIPSQSPSSFSSQELFPASSVSPRTPKDPPARKKPSRQEEKNKEWTIEQIRKAAALCSVEPEAVGDFQLRKALKPLLNLEK